VTRGKVFKTVTPDCRLVRLVGRVPPLERPEEAATVRRNVRHDQVTTTFIKLFFLRHLSLASPSNICLYCEQAVSETVLFRLLYSMTIIRKLSFYLYQMRAGESTAGNKQKREKERQRETD